MDGPDPALGVKRIASGGQSHPPFPSGFSTLLAPTTHEVLLGLGKQEP